MNARTLAPLVAALALVAVPVASATYWNYQFVTVTIGGEDHVQAGTTSCAGDGTPAPLVVVSSVPNPFEDCYEEPLVVEPVDPSGPVGIVTGAVDTVVETAGEVVGIVIGLIPEDEGGTYWNYQFVYVHVQDGEPEAGTTSCAGDGTPAPLVVVGSVPNPFEDCYKEPILLG